MIQNPIHKALLIVKSSNARFLVMGGQACVLYGAAEFSRDLDLTIGIDPKNVQAVGNALKHLKAEQILVPGFDIAALDRGHACHFRCRLSGIENLRIDLMSRMRGCSDFEVLWSRRTIADLPEVGLVGVLSLPDLVQAKKTQRDKDWPMIRRLIEADYLRSHINPTSEQIRFWLRECRTPALLVHLAKQYANDCRTLLAQRPLLQNVGEGDISAIEAGLSQEEQLEREADQEYWSPLRAELTQWRREKRAQ